MLVYSRKFLTFIFHRKTVVSAPSVRAGHSSASSRVASLIEPTAEAVTSSIFPCTDPSLFQRLEPGAGDLLVGGHIRPRHGSGKQDEGTQTRFQQQQQQLPAPVSLLRSHQSRSAGVLSPSHIARCNPKVMHLELAVDYSSSSRTSDRRERGGDIRESNSSFDTSATLMRGVGGDGSSSDLSMSPPPPPTFDFVVNDAKGKLQKWML